MATSWPYSARPARAGQGRAGELKGGGARGSSERAREGLTLAELVAEGADDLLQRRLVREELGLEALGLLGQVGRALAGDGCHRGDFRNW